MKYILPILISSYLLFSLVPFAIAAETGTPSAVVATPTPTITPTPVQPKPEVIIVNPKDPALLEGKWVNDPEVTLVGKNASRSGSLLDWVLRDYEWSYVSKNQANPLILFWSTMRNIVYALFAFVILVTAFLLITTRGKSLSIQKFIPRFLIAVFLVTLSFAITEAIYQTVDIFQGFFLKKPDGKVISSSDLLYIAFNYQDFKGMRLIGDEYNESAFISLLLVKLTALTYYAMAIILILRKIILWFFIIISPLFPLLLLYYPVRNTAKIWVGEFFRWLFYAPLFAIFLAGLVNLWKTSLPLFFRYDGVNNANQIAYPTAVNILLGGPGQSVSFYNSLNLPDTYALYLVALLMLWLVILLPFILLQIFLSYLSTVSLRDDTFLKYVVNLMNTRIPLLTGPTSPAPGTPPPAGRGLARSLPQPAPITNRFSLPSIFRPKPSTTGLAREIPRSVGLARQIPQTTELLGLMSLSIPTMQQIAQYDIARMSKDTTTQQNVSRMRETLQKIANPQVITNSSQRQQFTELRQKLLQDVKHGDQTAAQILAAINSSVQQQTQTTNTQNITNLQQFLQHIAHPTIAATSIEKEQYIRLKERLVDSVNQGNTLATTILNAVNILSQSTTQTATQHMEQVFQQLANPTPAVREVFQTIREQLTTASKSDNQFAQYVLTNIERLSSTQVSEQERQQISQTLQERLSEEKEKGNTLASTLLSSIQSVTKISDTTNVSMQNLLAELADPKTISDLARKETLTAIKESIVTQANAGNQFAQTMLTTIQQLSENRVSQEEKKHLVNEIQSQLFSEKEKGNVLATELVSQTNTSEQTQVFTKLIHDLAHPYNLSDSPIRAQIISLKERLVAQDKKSDPLASAILATTSTSLSETKLTERVTQLREQLTEARGKGDPLATQFLSVIAQIASERVIDLNAIQQQLLKAKQSGDPLAGMILSSLLAQQQVESFPQELPVVNRTQAVSLDDYEAIKKMWEETYRSADVPQSIDSPEADRASWIKSDIEEITNTINLLSSPDKGKVSLGMKAVSSILPFLLIGGFSQTEIIAYLKAKQEAAKTVLAELDRKENEEDTLVDRQEKNEEDKHMTTEEQEKLDEKS